MKASIEVTKNFEITIEKQDICDCIVEKLLADNPMLGEIGEDAEEVLAQFIYEKLGDGIYESMNFTINASDI